MGPGRQHVTPAEWLFGFVEERTGEEAADRDGRKRRAAVAYRGRVRLSPGRPVQPPDNEETLFVEGDAFRDGEHPRGFVRLKELSSPKPPSPPLYFEKPQSGGFPHHQLKIDHRPKGRKLYLHHREPDYRTEAGNADADAAKHRKMAVRPLKEEPVNQCGGFAFHIDFENLSRHELDLLCWALRPSDDFRHKLGLGKPLGLGSIEIEIEELALIDRHRRYAEENPFDGGRSRYRWTWTAADGSSDGCEAPSSRRQRWSAWMEERCPDAYAALIALGESHQLPQPATPVTYPLAHDQPQEEKLFQWHANNKRWWELGRGQRQWLDELGSGRSIRPLRKNRDR
jgi:CRISPR-associated protein (TIGR03986 family)